MSSCGAMCTSSRPLCSSNSSGMDLSLLTSPSILCVQSAARHPKCLLERDVGHATHADRDQDHPAGAPLHAAPLSRAVKEDAERPLLVGDDDRAVRQRGDAPLEFLALAREAQAHPTLD